tara:strand:- start:262 stop:483 length:222 start_codon:yes stop_codon:yes gene_type:complete
MKNEEDPLKGVIVTDFIENTDGNVEVTVEYTDEFVQRYKRTTGKKRAHKKSVADFLRKAVEENIKRAKELHEG